MHAVRFCICPVALKFRRNTNDAEGIQITPEDYKKIERCGRDQNRSILYYFTNRYAFSHNQLREMYRPQHTSTAYAFRLMQFKSSKATFKRFTKLSSPFRNQTRGSYCFLLGLSSPSGLPICDCR